MSPAFGRVRLHHLETPAELHRNISSTSFLVTKDCNVKVSMAFQGPFEFDLCDCLVLGEGCTFPRGLCLLVSLPSTEFNSSPARTASRVPTTGQTQSCLLF